MNKEQLISEMLLLPAAAIDYHLSQHLLQLFPDKAFIESEGYFNVEGYAQAQQCMLTRKTYSYNQMNTYWQGPEPQLLHPHHMGLQMGGVIINGMNPFPAFTAPPTQNATFANLILRGSLKQEILDDLVQFFASRTLYEEHDVPWKRGILFVGPAGNGKTHTVKALINSLEQPCLYVKSFRAPHTQGADEFNIRQVFDRARRTAPCVLVLEDLDSLLTSQNRSFFLNELDGFASNIGIVTLATTNHPERLDPSILDRPSRFDRKYPFDLPELPERSAYMRMWNESLKPSLRLTEEGAVKISELTDGFSFAYLKELFLSSKMRWIAHPQQGTMEQVMSEQVGKLREQMLSVNMLPASEIPEELQGMPPLFGPMMARSMRFQQRR